MEQSGFYRVVRGVVWQAGGLRASQVFYGLARGGLSVS